MALAVLITIMVNQFSREFAKNILKKNQDEVNIIINLIDNYLQSVSENIYIEANKVNIVTTVMNPDKTKYYIEDYLNEIYFGNYEGSFHVLAFNYETIKETTVSPYKNYSDWVSEDKLSIKLLDENGLIGIASPVIYNNLTEGYLVFKFNFRQIFSKSIAHIDSLKDEHSHQLRVYINDNVIAETEPTSNDNLSFIKPLTSIENITLEILTPKLVIEEPTNRLMGNFVFTSLIFSIIAVLLITFLTSASIASPLIKLKHNIDNASNSRGKVVNFNRNTANEIKIVGKAFNRIHKKLVRRSEQLEKRNIELESTQKQLIHNEKMASIGQLAAGVAHEINNPTVFVKSNLEILAEYSVLIKESLKVISSVFDPKNIVTPNEVIKAINSIENKKKIEYILEDLDPILEESLEGTKRIQKIVQGLKSFARQGNEEFAKGNVNKSIESAITLTRNEIKYKCKLHKNLSFLPDIICNLDQLTQVFVNLLINGSHAIPDYGDIYIISKLKKGKIIVKIADNGTGIKKENQSKLFEPFFSTKVTGKGTGLGLAISHGIIEKHNGSIKVASKVGMGTCFTIEIPAAVNKF